MVLDFVGLALRSHPQLLVIASVQHCGMQHSTDCCPLALWSTSGQEKEQICCLKGAVRSPGTEPPRRSVPHKEVRNTGLALAGFLKLQARGIKLRFKITAVCLDACKSAPPNLLGLCDLTAFLAPRARDLQGIARQPGSFRDFAPHTSQTNILLHASNAPLCQMPGTSACPRKRSGHSEGP